MPTIPMIAPDRTVRLIPLYEFGEAITHGGGKIVAKMRAPDDRVYWIPLDEVHDAFIGGGTLEFEPQLTKRRSLVIDPNRFTPHAHQLVGRLEDKIKVTLRKVQEVVLEALRTKKLRKDDPTDEGEAILDSEGVQTIMQAVKEVWDSIWSELPDSITADLQDAALAAASKAIVQADVHISDAGMINKLNQQARDFASERAAELVGMRRTEDGTIVPNPKAEWSIAETTRNEIKSIITQAFKDETPIREIEDAIKQAGAFSDARRCALGTRRS